MAYTATPETQTYTTQKIPAAYGIDLRPNAEVQTSTTESITQDAGMVNLVPLKYKDPLTKDEILTAFTRPSLVGQAVDATQTGKTPRGGYVWEKDDTHIYYYVVSGNRIYTSTDGNTWANVQNINDADTPVAFTEFITDTATKYLCMVQSTNNKMYVFTTNAAPTEVNIGFTPIPFLVFMDGYLFAAKADTGDIYNCDLNTPTSWTGGSFISSELYPDDIRAIAKIDNYLMAVGTQGCEFFYDAANATGSPLARVPEMAQPFGTAFPYTMAVNKNSAVFLANNNDGEMCLKVIENSKSSDIPAGWLMELISAKVGNNSSRTVDWEIPRGYFLRLRGNPLYVLSMRPYLTSFNANNYSQWISSPTFVYDFSSGQWFELQVTVGGVQYPFPVVCSSASRREISTNYVLGQAFTSALGQPVTFFASFNEAGNANATDAVTGYFTSNIATEIRTPIVDFGSLNRKNLHRFGVRATSSIGGTSVTTLSISYSDDNYNTFSTARNLTATDSTDFPFLFQMGQFRQRAFKLNYSGSARIWYKGLELELNRGVT